MNLDLSGKTALISGSTAGIGWAIARELALLGANCVLIARNEEKLKNKVAELTRTGDQIHRYIRADFAHPDEVQSQIEQFIDSHTIDILVNNSGGPAAGPVFSAEREQFISAFEQHLICNHILTRSVVPGMKANGFGRIVNIISTSVKVPLKGLGVSNTIRGAVASWSKTMSNELAPYGITVNNVLPGATKTGRLESIIENKARKMNSEVQDVEKEMMDEIPMKRFGQPEEIAAVAAFLCTPAAAYTTGVSIQVDGGRTGTIV